VTAQGHPVPRAAVEVRNLRGIKMAAGFTDTAGSFAVTTVAKPGEYVILAAKELQVGDERITLDQADREVTIALPFAAAGGTSQQMYTVSTLAFMDDFERIPVWVKYIGGVVSRIVFHSCPR
jgi:hypothetical protein